ncbi:tetratricopeptide repeat protein [Demequina sp. NBRC 110056]|uniref:tetratricopeptide repeat protein n=1 Tax=Demequina sp. NBRC 110056 TaxID=1570345 RepID=UPI000A0424CC|nr:tetratricopeptide repeat protein [Demequina sp. NBRC 110056]
MGRRSERRAAAQSPAPLLILAAWDREVAAFWEVASREEPDAVLDGARALAAQRPAGDAPALFELASAHDYVGDELAAVPLYEQALDAGLSGRRRDEAVIQLASSLRNVGRPADALALLDSVAPGAGDELGEDLAPAGQAFRALVLRDLGRGDEAVTVALTTLAPTLAQYGGAVARYAAGSDQ